MKTSSNGRSTEFVLDSLTKSLILKTSGLPALRRSAEQVAKTLDSEMIYQYVQVLVRNESWRCRSSACYMLPYCFQIASHRAETQRILLGLAKDTDWRVRESAAWSIYKLLNDNFDGLYALVLDWAISSNENVRRAIIIGAMKVGKHRDRMRARPLLELVELLLNDTSRYVQKAIVFAIGDGLLRYYPSCTLEYLATWSASAEMRVRWIVAMSLSKAEARNHMQESVAILRKLCLDETKVVRNVATRALTNLGQVPGDLYQRMVKQQDQEGPRSA